MKKDFAISQLAEKQSVMAYYIVYTGLISLSTSSMTFSYLYPTYIKA